MAKLILFIKVMSMCYIGNHLLSVRTCACNIAICSKWPYHFLTASDGPAMHTAILPDAMVTSYNVFGLCVHSLYIHKYVIQHLDKA